MKTIVCRECGKELSNKAIICPHCGIKVHPIRDMIKVIAVVMIILCTLLVGALIASGSLEQMILESKYKRYFGTYELVGRMSDYEEAYSGSLYDGNGNCLEEPYQIEDIDSMLKLETSRSDRYSYLNSGLMDHEFIYSVEQEYVIVGIGAYRHYDQSIDTYACFIAKKGYLMQTDCSAGTTNDLGYIENIGLRYQKVK